jgi:phosphoglycerate dehydrogenase-like enzyme
VVIHANLNPTSFKMFGLEQFRKMKRSAFIVNTARGTIIDEQASVTALREGYIAGAGLVVNEREPIFADSPLTKFDNVILTGHRAGSSIESSVVWGQRPAKEVTCMQRREWAIGLENPVVKERFIAKWGLISEPHNG